MEAENVAISISAMNIKYLFNFNKSIKQLLQLTSNIKINAGVQKMSERTNEVRGKFWLIGENFDEQFKN